jgi:hypothetical protein
MRSNSIPVRASGHGRSEAQHQKDGGDGVLELERELHGL